MLSNIIIQHNNDKASGARIQLNRSKPHVKKSLKSDLIPANGTFFSLAEAFNLIQAKSSNVNTFWNEATDEKIHGENVQLVCARSSFFRRWKKFQTDRVTPSPGDYGIRVVAPRIVDYNHLHLVNDQLKNTI